MNHTLTVSGAYSTDFKNKTQILDYYNSNKDFLNLGLSQGAYVNKKDAKRFKVGFLNVRYSNLSKVAVIDVNTDKFI
jgi:hypothetical protein